MDDLRLKIRDALHVPEPLPALDISQHGSSEIDSSVVIERVSYTTQLGMRVPAIVYRPRVGKGRMPALIVVNGHGGDKFSWYAMYAGVAYARIGFVVVTYDPAGEGERNAERKSGTRAHDRVIEPERLGRWLGGLMMTDVMQAVSYLLSRGDVDPARVAAAGYSMGSFVVALAAAADSRIGASVMAGGGNLDGVGGYWDRSKAMCQGVPYQAMSFLGDRAAALYALHRRALIYNGREDTVVAMQGSKDEFFADLNQRVIAKGGRAIEWVFVDGASHRPWFVTRPVAEWLAGRDLSSEGQTRIAGWAWEHGVTLDPLYATYDREGGTLALGRAVSALRREELNVFSDTDWQRERGRLIHEAWLERARKG